MTTKNAIKESNVNTENTEKEQIVEKNEIKLTENEQNGIIAVTGRVNFNKLGAPQASYNLLVTDEHAKNVLTALSQNERLPFQASNANGEFYVTVTMSTRSAMIAKRGGAGSPSVVVSGTLYLGDVINGRPTGDLEVREARRLTFGEAMARTRTPRETVTDGVEPATSGASRSLRR